MRPSLFPHYALLEGHDRFDRLPAAGRRDASGRCIASSCDFPSPVELLREIGARQWFAQT